MGFFEDISNILKLSKEARGWKKLQLKTEDIRKVEIYTQTLSRLQQAFSLLNTEMQTFNQNITQSNSFLKQIADLQKSMEKQTKSANRITLVVIGLAILQVAIALAPYRSSILAGSTGTVLGGIHNLVGLPPFIILGIGWILFGLFLGIWYMRSKQDRDTINAIAIIGGFVGIGITVIALAH